MVVTVPRWGWGQATDVLVARPSVLREVCTVVLHDHGRRTIFVAWMPGATYLGATVYLPATWKCQPGAAG